MKGTIPSQLNRTVEELREKYLLSAEFVLRVRELLEEGREQGRLPEPKGPLEAYALSLGKKELENCLFLLLAETEPEKKEKLLEILRLRMSPRLTRLIWALTQYYYELPAVRRAAALGASAGYCTEELLCSLFLEEQDCIGAGADILRQKGGSVARFISDFHVLTDSPFCKAVVRLFFREGKEKDFLTNEDYFLRLIESDSEEEIKPVLINYLAQPWVFYSSRKINKMLFQRFGLPEDGVSPIWQEIDSQLILKYQHWVFLDSMEDFFGAESKRYLIFSKFYKELRHIRFYQEKQIMILDFAQFGIVNLQDVPEFSYLMEKGRLEREAEHLAEGGEPRWLQSRGGIEARDVIIEEKSSDILILHIVGLGKLYVEELMRELLRKGEELWPVRFKHAILRFKSINGKQ